jgi:hypothetical protein
MTKAQEAVEPPTVRRIVTIGGGGRAADETRGGLHICLPAALRTQRGARCNRRPLRAREEKLAGMFMVGPYPIRRAFSRQVSCRFVQNVFPVG